MCYADPVLYLFSSPAACWTCVLAAGNTNLEIQRPSAKGLVPPHAGATGELAVCSSMWLLRQVSAFSLTGALDLHPDCWCCQA